MTPRPADAPQMHPRACIVCDEDATLDLRVRTVRLVLDGHALRFTLQCKPVWCACNATCVQVLQGAGAGAQPAAGRPARSRYARCRCSVMGTGASVTRLAIPVKNKLGK